MNKSRTTRVLVVDDSPFVRETLTTELSKVDFIEVVGSAADPFEASELLTRLRPDVMTLDMEMPHMNGQEFLRQVLPQWPIPIIIVSACTARGSHEAQDAFSAGAMEIVYKPRSLNAFGFRDMMQELVTKIKKVHGIAPFRPAPCDYSVIAIGASTGGPQALSTILHDLPSQLPPIVIVQHLPLGFSGFFAQSLAQDAGIDVREAIDGALLKQGQIHIAPCGMQTAIKPWAGGFKLRVFKAPSDAVTYHPAVDVLFHSVAQHAGQKGLGILLTGMGHDGAKGLKSMRDTGAYTIAQDEATSVVYGMPQVAKKLGAVMQELPLTQIRTHLLRLLKTHPR